MHWARLIECLHAAEMIRKLLDDTDLQGTSLVVTGKRESEGVGIIEAPRGTLFHHYRVGANDQIDDGESDRFHHEQQRADEPCRGLRGEGHDERQEGDHGGDANAVEVAIRAYDPCLSCATHAYGQMPLEISLVDSKGDVVDRRLR